VVKFKKRSNEEKVNLKIKKDSAKK